VAWLLPELDIGVEPELRPLELELEPEPVELELPELEPVEVEPEPVEEPEPELVEEPEPDDAEEPEPDDAEEPEPDDAEEPEPDDVEAVLCVDPGRAKATTPAAATLATVTAVVADRTLARPRARAAMAWRTRSRGALLMCSILRSGTRRLLNEPSRLAMRRGPFRRPEGEATDTT
jgi:outer membrane biosynthesis protein TonB